MLSSVVWLKDEDSIGPGFHNLARRFGRQRSDEADFSFADQELKADLDPLEKWSQAGLV